MAKNAQGGGANARPLDDTIAQTGPGIADDALLPARKRPSPLTTTRLPGRKPSWISLARVRSSAANPCGRSTRSRPGTAA
jgi:hypothetical protein